MNRHTLHRTMLSLTTAVTFAATVGAPSSAAPPVTDSTPTSGATERISSITDGVARRLAASLADQTNRGRIVASTLAGPVDLSALDAGPGFARTIAAANHSVLVAKGLPETGPSLLRVRLANPDMRSALAQGGTPLVVAPSTDDGVRTVIGYEPDGRQVTLNDDSGPKRPVLVVEVDVAKALPLGLRVMRDTLTAHGIGSAADGVTDSVVINGGYWANKVTAVRLSDDKEPWIKGAAEIFNVVGGFGLDGHVKIDTVTMPYLDHDSTTYYPNQLLVHYSAYKYNLADVVMMEDDGDTNYLALAQAIATALLTIVDMGAYAPLVNAILGAMPNSWWTDDPDYVESWYTLATTTSGRRYGAAANGWLDIQPYWVQAF